MIKIANMQQKKWPVFRFWIQKRFIYANDLLLFSDRFINNETHSNKILHIITWSFFLISVFRVSNSWIKWKEVSWSLNIRKTLIQCVHWENRQKHILRLPRWCHYDLVQTRGGHSPKMTLKLTSQDNDWLINPFVLLPNRHYDTKIHDLITPSPSAEKVLSARWAVRNTDQRQQNYGTFTRDRD